MRTPEEHLSAVRAAFPTPGVQLVPLIDAPSRTLARDVTAAHPSPRFDNSQMDGYALSTAHLAGGTFPVGPTLPAGTDPARLYPEGVGAQLVPIMTGAQVPAGTAAIVPVEAAMPTGFAAEGARVSVPPTEEGRFIRRRGSDTAAGEVVLAAGSRLTAVSVGVLASQGVSEVAVVERSGVVICTGGAEIGGSEPAMIPDANGPMLRALCAAAGIEVLAQVCTDDDPERLRGQLSAVVAEHRPRAIITSGGISAGKFEVVRQLLAGHGWFGHVSQQPGGPQGLATFEGVPVVCLPGNPVSTMVSFRLFAAPVLGYAPAPVSARLREGLHGLPTKDQFWRGRWCIAPDGTALAGPVGGAGSHLLAQAVAANCLIRVPAGARLAEDDLVTVYPLEALS